MKRYNKEIIEVQKVLDKLLIELPKTNNYAILKMDEPPSDS